MSIKMHLPGDRLLTIEPRVDDGTACYELTLSCGNRNYHSQGSTLTRTDLYALVYELKKFIDEHPVCGCGAPAIGEDATGAFACKAHGG